MKRVLLSLLGWALIGSLAWTGSAFARPVSGSNELLVSGGFFHSQGAGTGALNADVSYGYFIVPAWELGFRQSLNYNFIDNARDVWTATTTPFMNFHLPISDILVPYAGGFIGPVWNDRDVTGTVGPQAGVKLFVQDQTFINLGYRYEWFFNSIKTIGNDSSHGNHVVNIGVGFLWGGSGAKRP